jgi:hypothetical protein
MSERYRNPQMGTKLRKSIELGNQEVNFKMSDRTAIIQPTVHQTAQQVAEDLISEVSHTVPSRVKTMMPYNYTDIRVITQRLINKDANVTPTERAQWLMYSDARSVAVNYMTVEDIQEAEQLIRSIWGDYQSVL